MDPNVYLAYMYFLKNQDGGIKKMDDPDGFPVFKDRLTMPLLSIICERQRHARSNFILQEQILWSDASPTRFKEFLKKYRNKK
jgi:hypothetical protein